MQMKEFVKYHIDIRLSILFCSIVSIGYLSSSKSHSLTALLFSLFFVFLFGLCLGSIIKNLLLLMKYKKTSGSIGRKWLVPVLLYIPAVVAMIPVSIALYKRHDRLFVLLAIYLFPVVVSFTFFFGLFLSKKMGLLDDL